MVDHDGYCQIECDSDGYIAHNGWVNMYQNVKGTYYNTDKSTCKSYCDNDTGCRMYEHNPATQVCTLENCGGDTCGSWQYNNIDA